MQNRKQEVIKVKQQILDSEISKQQLGIDLYKEETKLEDARRTFQHFRETLASLATEPPNHAVKLGPSEVICETYDLTESKDSDERVNVLQNSQGNQGSQRYKVNSSNRFSRFTHGTSGNTQIRHDTLVTTEQTTYGSGAENLEFNIEERNPKKQYLMDTDMSQQTDLCRISPGQRDNKHSESIVSNKKNKQRHRKTQSQQSCCSRSDNERCSIQ